jgi:hypothetical protein
VSGLLAPVRVAHNVASQAVACDRMKSKSTFLFIHRRNYIVVMYLSARYSESVVSVCPWSITLSSFGLFVFTHNDQSAHYGSQGFAILT